MNTINNTSAKAVTIDLDAVARLLGIGNTTPFKVGYADGFEQGFELIMGMSYEDDSAQWAYDLGTHIGAAFKVKGTGTGSQRCDLQRQLNVAKATLSTIAGGFVEDTNMVKTMMELASSSLRKIEDEDSEIVSTLNLSVMLGVATLPDQSQINLCEIQRTCNNAFQQTGLAEHAIAADNLSKLTGLVQGGRGEWLRVDI